MKINHLALWRNNIETMKDYYEKFFDGKVGKKYNNESCVLDPEGNLIKITI